MSKIADIIYKAIIAERNGAPDEYIKNLVKGIDVCHVKVYREDAEVKLPTYSKPGDACMDVYVHRVEKKDDGRIIYHTGLYFRLPEDYEMEIRPRSSITKTMEFMPNCPGTLDSSYTGELMIVHRNSFAPNEVPELTWYNVGDRVAQILIRRREFVSWDLTIDKADLGVTERGDGGFGSTGK